MKAAVYTRYGPPDVVQVRDWPTPEPKSGEVLVKIHATTVSAADWRARSLVMPRGFGLLGRLVFGVFGPRKPILGTDFAGVVQAVGAGVTTFKPGDRVFGAVGMGMGCHAQYRCIRIDGAIAGIPDGLSFTQAAAIPFGAVTALFFLRDRARLSSGERVLVIGASGAVGSAAVQIAKQMGAHVTGVCSTANLDLVRSLGANKVIDYTTEDFTRNGQTYDVIMDNAGATSFTACKGSLAPSGRLLLVVSSLGALLAAPFQSRRGGKQVLGGTGSDTADDLQYLVNLATSGGFTPVIEVIYPLSDIVAAHAHVATGRKIGSVVIAMPA